MVPQTDQVRTWLGDFGREYTDRNIYAPAELDELYRRRYGITRTAVNQRALNGIPRNARILEVGCNMGNQLLLLGEMGYSNLYGIEIQDYALQRARKRVPEAVLTSASAFEIPYPDNSFDLVFTSGVLIHIAPTDLARALGELYRCSRQWIWGFEYFASENTEVLYCGLKSMLWKADYARLYKQQFDDLHLIGEDRLHYLRGDNLDSSFLLRRNL